MWVSPLVDDVLSISDRFIESNVSLYPNPATSQLTISLLDTAEADIRVYDLVGKLMIYEANKLIANKHTLDISSLAAGAFFIRINSEYGTVTKKFIKN